MQKLGKAFGDMPGITSMFAGAGAVEGGEAEGADEADADAPESEFLNAAMEGDVDAIKKAIEEAAAGAAPSTPLHLTLPPPLPLWLLLVPDL